jgi:hypothetical protein
MFSPRKFNDNDLQYGFETKTKENTKNAPQIQKITNRAARLSIKSPTSSGTRSRTAESFIISPPTLSSSRKRRPVTSELSINESVVVEGFSPMKKPRTTGNAPQRTITTRALNSANSTQNTSSASIPPSAVVGRKSSRK